MKRCMLMLAAIIALPALIPARANGPGVGCPEASARCRFGIVEAYYRPDDARDLGVGWDRVIFDWAHFQPNGPRDFHTGAVPETILIEAREAGREIVGLIKSTPGWASGGDKPGLVPHGLDLPFDDPGNVWAAFVERLVKYYDEEWDITHWIILNEPDLRPGEIAWYEFDGEVADYYLMLKNAYLAAKSVNPDAVILVAGMAWWTDVQAGRTPYLKRLLEYAARDPEAVRYGYFFDVATVHAYFVTASVWHQLFETLKILWHYDLQDKPVWVMESNARPSVDPDAELPDDSPYEISLAQQADFIVQAAALSLAAGVERFCVYRLYDDHYTPGEMEPWGLVRGDGSRRPAFDAYRTVIRVFADTTDAHWRYSKRSSLVMLEQPDQTVYVMWARSAEDARFHIWAGNNASSAWQVALDGELQAITPQKVPGGAGWWFVAETPGVVLGVNSEIAVEGSPVILVIPGTLRTVWVEVDGAYLTLH